MVKLILRHFLDADHGSEVWKIFDNCLLNRISNTLWDYWGGDSKFLYEFAKTKMADMSKK